MWQVHESGSPLVDLTGTHISLLPSISVRTDKLDDHFTTKVRNQICKNTDTNVPVA
jgi:hypothetical protein